jgi:hypothetical protein
VGAKTLEGVGWSALGVGASFAAACLALVASGRGGLDTLAWAGVVLGVGVVVWAVLLGLAEGLSLLRRACQAIEALERNTRPIGGERPAARAVSNKN